MSFGTVLWLVLVLLAVGVAIAWLGRHFFSTEARLERRRRRSNYRVANKGRRPRVRFSVRTRKD